VRLFRSVDSAMRHWALALPKGIGNAATVALVVLLLGLVVFGSWVAVQTGTTTATVQQSVGLNTAFQNARFAVEQEEALGFEYRLSPGNQFKAEHAYAANAVVAELAKADLLGDEVDRSVIQQIRTAHTVYVDASHRFFDAIDAGDLAGADAIATREVSVIFQTMEDLINKEALEHQNESAAALHDQESLSHGVLRIFPLVLGLGLLLVGFLTLVLDVTRRARDARSSVMARVSHELRTPLNSILGFSQLFLLTEGGALNDKQRRYLNNIQSSGTHLLGLINDVLDMSKVEAGKMVMDLAPIALDAVIDAVLEEVGPLMSAKHLHLPPPTGTRGLTVVADRMRLRQILLNGLSNAIKFTDSRGSIAIATRSSKGEALIEVTDTGTGIPAAQLARMFKEFEQLDNSQTRLGEGTGLGLPLSKGLAEMMGGSLRLSSREGLGTTFQVRLPLAAKATTPPRRTTLKVEELVGEPALTR
jgi:signal transduction histidine kinase